MCGNLIPRRATNPVPPRRARRCFVAARSTSSEAGPSNIVNGLNLVELQSLATMYYDSRLLLADARHVSRGLGDLQVHIDVDAFLLPHGALQRIGMSALAVVVGHGLETLAAAVEPAP